MRKKKKAGARPKRAKAGAKRVARRKGIAAKRRAKPVKGKARPIKKKTKPVKKASPESMLEKIGEVTHYFPHVKAAAVRMLKDGLKVGDEIYIKGHTTDFKEKVASIQLDHLPIQEGKKAQEIGLLVKSRVRIGDSVYKL